MSIRGAVVLAVVLALWSGLAGAETEPRLIGWLGKESTGSMCERKRVDMRWGFGAGETHSVASSSESSWAASQSTLPELPLVGFGTAALGPDTGKHVAEALDVGYRLLDSAQVRRRRRRRCVAPLLVRPLTVWMAWLVGFLFFFFSSVVVARRASGIEKTWLRRLFDLREFPASRSS